VALGFQGVLRRLVAGEVIRPAPPGPSPLVSAARIAAVSREEVAPETRPEDLAALLAPDSILAWTESADGGWLLGRAADGAVLPPRRYPAIPSDHVVDPTGAGDVFLAALLAATLRPELAGAYDAPTFAAAAGSLAVEGPGLAGVPDLAAVRRRLTRAPSRASR
jgi:sugar/nucleoside kinase (ribokinase family)